MACGGGPVDVLLEEAARKAQQLEASGQADVLVTGGANATFLESLPLTLPVVRIKVTGFDLMQALWSAKRLDRWRWSCPTGNRFPSWNGSAICFKWNSFRKCTGMWTTPRISCIAC